jgi:hypothetical protein
MLVPTLDIDLMWHTHMLFPVQYATDCKQITGIPLINHDDEVCVAVISAFLKCPMGHRFFLANHCLGQSAFKLRFLSVFPFVFIKVEDSALGEQRNTTEDSWTAAFGDAFPYNKPSKPAEPAVTVQPCTSKSKH